MKADMFAFYIKWLLCKGWRSWCWFEFYIYGNIKFDLLTEFLTLAAWANIWMSLGCQEPEFQKSSIYLMVVKTTSDFKCTFYQMIYWIPGNNKYFCCESLRALIQNWSNIKDLQSWNNRILSEHSFSPVKTVPVLRRGWRWCEWWSPRARPVSRSAADSQLSRDMWSR